MTPLNWFLAYLTLYVWLLVIGIANLPAMLMAAAIVQFARWRVARRRMQ